MNDIHHNRNKNHDFEKMYPRCLGRMTDLFELNMAAPKNTLLNDKQHLRVSPLSRSRSDGSRTSPSSHSLEEKVISNRKSKVTLMKTLIAQEMSVEVDHRQDPPNLVTQLMDIDALPQQIQQQSPKSLRKGRNEEETILYVRKMNLVREKFIEAKRLSMDEKLRQSKQFQDALDVLNSNRDLFLKCLQEPNSTFSQPLYSPQSVETNRITVLRPSKVAANINDLSRGRYVDEKEIKSGILRRNNLDESATQQTRIVVLKPSPEKLHNVVQAVGTTQSNLPNVLLSEEFCRDGEDSKCRESREVAKAITQQMREKLGNSSVFSNGYIGDESSFSKSEIEFAMSPVSRHSWDYSDRLGNPCASSSFARASSSESSVCREAKKRLSKRWAVMASSGCRREQIHFGSGSSTLGDMLALFDEHKNSDARLVCAERTEEENVDYSQRNFMRSKSVPVLSTEFGIKVNLDVSVSDERKPEFLKEGRKERSVKSSLRGKVSNLFFSMNKKSCKNKSLVAETRGGVHCYKTEGQPEPNLIGQLGMMSPETGSTVAEPIALENHDQAHPISVLDPPLVGNEHSAKGFSRYIKTNGQYGTERPLNFIGPGLIDKSPSIESLVRTLSWDNSFPTSSSHPTNESTTMQKTDEERKWFFLVKTLLSVAGLEDEAQTNSTPARWHSPESPLDPYLRGTYINDLDDKQWQRRSTQELVFDCVNEVLIGIVGCESYSCRGAIRADSCMLDLVWAQVKVLFYSQERCVAGDNDLLVERVVKKEVVGKVWNDNFRPEVDNLMKEIGGELLEELVQETVVEYYD